MISREQMRDVETRLMQIIQDCQSARSHETQDSEECAFLVELENDCHEKVKQIQRFVG